MTLAYRVEGVPGAPSLVLLNSIGATTGMWDGLAPALAERFRLIRIETRGHGGSPTPPATGPVTLADLAADVLAVLDELGVNRAHVAGLSLGGLTALWLAAHAPHRVGRIAVLCAAIDQRRQKWQDRAAAVRAGGLDTVAEQTVPVWLTAAAIDRDPELARRCREMLAGADPEGYAQCCEVLADLAIRADLPAIDVPTLAIAGADDPAAPTEQLREVADLVPGARLAVVGPAAHVATFEQPAAITALLSEHFAPSGETTRREVLGDAHVERAAAGTTEFTAPFQQFLTRYAWGEVWNRPGLPRRDRSIATLAALTALGAEPEIGMHVRAALRNGLTREEIAEVLLHTAVYAGLPRANQAFAAAARVLDETPG